MKTQDELEQKQRRIMDAREEDYDNPTLQAKDEMLGFLLGKMDSPTEAIQEPPTDDAELEQLIKAVQAEYEGLPQFSFFGDDNWKFRDAELEILEWAKGS